ncbi:MAG TPA: hypothetical protein VNN79_21455 [Actinomycetota bacterium]|nr:hypothetical protein [Actinomycetota bacterium]
MSESQWHQMDQAEREQVAARCRSIATMRAAVNPTRSHRNLMPAILRGAEKR